LNMDDFNILTRDETGLTIRQSTSSKPIVWISLVENKALICLEGEHVLTSGEGKHRFGLDKIRVRGRRRLAKGKVFLAERGILRNESEIGGLRDEVTDYGENIVRHRSTRGKLRWGLAEEEGSKHVREVVRRKLRRVKEVAHAKNDCL